MPEELICKCGLKLYIGSIKDSYFVSCGNPVCDEMIFRKKVYKTRKEAMEEQCQN